MKCINFFTSTDMLGDGDLDERAMEAIKEFCPERALEILDEFKNSNLEHVTNKTAFLCSIIKVNRRKAHDAGGNSSDFNQPARQRPGPDESKIKVHFIWY